MNATDDPFLYLPHHLSLELLAARYLFIAVAAVSAPTHSRCIKGLILQTQSWLWDCLLSLSDDIRMVEKCGFKLPDMVYFSSRYETFFQCLYQYEELTSSSFNSVLTCAYIILAVLFIGKSSINFTSST